MNSPAGTAETHGNGFSRPYGTSRIAATFPRTASWAKFGSPLRGWPCKSEFSHTLYSRPGAFPLLVLTEQSVRTWLFLKKSHTSPRFPVQSRSENALELAWPRDGVAVPS